MTMFCLLIAEVYIHDNAYAYIWAPIFIFGASLSGGHFLCYSRKSKVYQIMSGLSIVVSIFAGGIFIHSASGINSGPDYLSEPLRSFYIGSPKESYWCDMVRSHRRVYGVLSVAMIFNILFASAAIYYLRKKKNPPTPSKIARFRTESNIQYSQIQK